MNKTTPTSSYCGARYAHIREREGAGKNLCHAMGTDSAVSFILSHLYPRTATLKDAIKTITGAGDSARELTRPGDPPAYLDLCKWTIVAGDNNFEENAFHANVRETRQSVRPDCSVTAFKAILTTARRVSTSWVFDIKVH